MSVNESKLYQLVMSDPAMQAAITFEGDEMDKDQVWERVVAELV